MSKLVTSPDILCLTEPFTFISMERGFMPKMLTTVYPGLVSVSCLREQAGDRLVDSALRCGVLQKNE